MTDQERLAELLGGDGYRDTGHRVTKRYPVGECPHCAIMSIHEHTNPVFAPKPLAELIEIAEARFLSLGMEQRENKLSPHPNQFYVRWDRVLSSAFASAVGSTRTEARMKCAIKGRERLKEGNDG